MHQGYENRKNSRLSSRISYLNVSRGRRLYRLAVMQPKPVPSPEDAEDSKIRKEALILFDYSKLNGRIVEKFGSQRAFAKALGKSEVIISRKLCGKAGITTRDIATWSSDKFLDIPGDQIGDYFFKVKVQDFEQ